MSAPSNIAPADRVRIVFVDSAGHGRLRAALERRGCWVGVTGCADEILDLVRQLRPELVIMDSANEGAVLCASCHGIPVAAELCQHFGESHCALSSPAHILVTLPLRLRRGNGERVLLAHDDESWRAAATVSLEAHGFEILQASDGAAAATLGAASRIDFALVKNQLALMDGPSTIRVLRRLRPEMPVGLICARNDRFDPEELKLLRVGTVLAEHCSSDGFALAVLRGLQDRHGQAEEGSISGDSNHPLNN